MKPMFEKKKFAMGLVIPKWQNLSFHIRYALLSQAITITFIYLVCALSSMSWTLFLFSMITVIVAEDSGCCRKLRQLCSRERNSLQPNTNKISPCFGSWTTFKRWRVSADLCLSLQTEQIVEARKAFPHQEYKFSKE